MRLADLPTTTARRELNFCPGYWPGSYVVYWTPSLWVQVRCPDGSLSSNSFLLHLCQQSNSYYIRIYVVRNYVHPLS